MSASLIKVLNADTRRIVMLPLANKVVIKQDGIFHHLSTNMPAIDDKSYQALIGLLELSTDIEAELNTTRNYFIERCIGFAGEDKPLVGHKGYGLIFDQYSDAGYDIKVMLERLEFIIYSWNEEDSAAVLDRTYSDWDDAETILTAIDIIKAENVTDAFVTTYQDDDRLMVIYGDSGLKLIQDQAVDYAYKAFGE